MGEYQNVALEELVDWVNENLPKNAVMAGPMPTMANLLLSTGRPIVNHPHYEDVGIRERTKKVYTVFSRKSKDEVHRSLVGLKVQVTNSAPVHIVHTTGFVVVSGPARGLVPNHRERGLRPY